MWVWDVKMGIRLVHQDGDVKITLDQNDQGDYMVMLISGAELVRSKTYMGSQMIDAMGDYVQTITNEIASYGRDLVEQQAIEALVRK